MASSTCIRCFMYVYKHSINMHICTNVLYGKTIMVIRHLYLHFDTMKTPRWRA